MSAPDERPEVVLDPAPHQDPRLSRTLQVGLALLRVVLLVGVVGGLGSAVVLPVNQMTQAEAYVEVPLSTSDASASASRYQEDLARSVAVTPSGAQQAGVDVRLPQPTVKVSMRDAGAGWKLLSELGTAVRRAAVGVGCLMGFLLLGTIDRWQPFHPANARRFSVLALVTVVGTYGAGLVEGLAAGALLDRFGATVPAPPSAPLDLAPVLVAIGFLTLAAVFRVGARLSDETSGLV